LLFLEACEKHNIPASPWLKAPRLIVKHRNEEGGLGLQLFSNAAAGGDWIVQHALTNGASIAKFLPANAPLSTMRIVSSSSACLRPKPVVEARPSDITLLSACWRAGRAGADTDHKSILFDVDMGSGAIGGGTSNSHWSQLGPWEASRCPWRSRGHTVSAHPDGGAMIAGEKIAGMQQVRELVRNAHVRLCPGVPLVGWDVAITEEAGFCLLEANLSCNFFRATFDEAAYYSFVEQCFLHIESGAYA